MNILFAKRFFSLLAFTLSLWLTSHTHGQEVNGWNLYDLTYYYGSGGTFVDVGSNKWIERNQDGEFHFEEINRDAWSVYLKRGSMILALDMWTKTIKWQQSDGSWRIIYNIREGNVVNNGFSDENIVTLFQHNNYQGYSVKLPEGNFTLEDLQRRGMRNDDISSLKVPSGYRVTLYENDNFDTPLYFFGILVGGGWELTVTTSTNLPHNNDETSSVRVERMPEDSSWWLDCDGFYGYFEMIFSDYPIGSECD